MVFLLYLFVEKRNIIISEGNRPLWQIIIAALFYTLAFILLGMFFFGYEIVFQEEIDSQGDIGAVWTAGFCISQGILFSSVKHIFFDLTNKKYKEQYQVGPIKIGRWKTLPKIDYVSVFKQPKENGNYIFETNLWYQGNKHFNIYENLYLDPAFLMGESVAKTLEVKLLDATEANNFKWVNLA